MENKMPMQNDSSSSQVTNFTIDYVTADTIGVSYDTLIGNMPSTYGNYIALWQNDVIPWNQEPIAKQTISTDTQSGSMTFTELQITGQNYIVGYAVGSENSPSFGQQTYGNICSTGFIPESGSDYQYFQANLTLISVTPNSVAVNFQVPPGCQPATNKAWIGMWRSSQASYNNPPDSKTPITIDAESGTIALNNVKILRGMTYTVALFMGGWQGETQQSDQTAMAATLTFTNS